MMDREFLDALDHCLDLLRRGTTLEECLARYPEFAQELRPLLESAVVLNRGTAVAPRPEARRRGRERVLAAAEQRSRRRSWMRALLWRPLLRPALMAGVALALLGAVAGGTTVAASQSVPGDPLYWVKGVREKVVTTLPRSEVARAELQVRLAEERGRELETLLARGRLVEAEALVSRMAEHLERSAHYISLVTRRPSPDVAMAPPPEAFRFAPLLRRLKSDQDYLMARLERALRQAPPSQRPAMQELVQRARGNYKAFMDFLEERERLYRSPRPDVR